MQILNNAEILLLMLMTEKKTIQNLLLVENG